MEELNGAYIFFVEPDEIDAHYASGPQQTSSMERWKLAWEKLMLISEIGYYQERDMRRVWKYRVAVIFLLVVLMGGTAAVSVTIMGITLALLVVALVGVLVILLAISRFRK
jgi:hypothetical protein